MDRYEYMMVDWYRGDRDAWLRVISAEGEPKMIIYKKNGKKEIEESTATGLIKLANRLGDNGWEMFSISQAGEAGQICSFLFKRKVTE